MLLFIDKTQFEPNQPLSHVLALRANLSGYQHIIESVSSDKASDQRLGFNRDRDQVAALTFHEGLGIVISLTADRAEALVNTFIALEFLEVCKTCSMINMTATQNSLILEL